MNDTFENLFKSRISKINESNKFYFWSIKNSKVMSASVDDFKNERACECCIPVYRAKNSPKLVKCNSKFDCFVKFKKHVLYRENTFKRQLIWIDKSKIPSNLKRIREIGDLSSLENEKILKIKFDTRTIVKSRDNLIISFKKYGCPCKEGDESKCNVKISGSQTFFSHLSSLERKHIRYIVFKGELNELGNDGESNSSNLSDLSSNMLSFSENNDETFNSADLSMEILDLQNAILDYDLENNDRKCSRVNDTDKSLKNLDKNEIDIKLNQRLKRVYDRKIEQVNDDEFIIDKDIQENLILKRKGDNKNNSKKLKKK